MEIFSSDNSRRFRRIGLLMSAISLVFGGIAIAESQSFSVLNSFAIASVTATLCFVVFGLSASQTAEQVRRLHRHLNGFHFMFDHLPQAILLFSNKKRLVYANKAYSEYYGIDRDILKPGLTEAELVAIRRAMGLPVLADCELISVELELDGETVQSDVWRLEDGRYIQFEHITTSSGGWIAQHRDITTELKQQQAAQETNRFLETVLQSVPSAIAVKNANTLRYEYVNEATLSMNGWHLDDVVGRRASDLFAADAAAKIDQRDQDTLNLAAGEVMEKEEIVPKLGAGYRIINSKRMVVRDFSGKPSKILLVIDDITERREAEQKVSFMARHDALTGLKNRAWFNETIHNANSATGSDAPLALVLLDLDGFKNVNDTFGHAAGDMTLTVFAEKLRKRFGEDTAIARLGGDEFAVIVCNASNETELKDKLTALIQDVAEPIVFEDHRVAVNCSAGVTIVQPGEYTSAELVSQADIALYEAKRIGKATYCCFTPDLGSRKLQSKALEMRLRNAVSDKQLQLHYQPIVDANSGLIVSMEALVRWFDGERGMIAPCDFIPLAEETGLIVPLGEQVLEMACRAAVRWPKDVRVSVNISPIQFRDLNLVQKVNDILKRTGLAPTRLELEITEATLLADDTDSIRTLNTLRNTGVRIVMDDFGTGYSSLNYIRSFPFDKIKIDKSYIDELSTVSNKSNVILHSVLSMARHLELCTTAEGVETQDQMRLLRDAGCTELQGFYFNKPMAESDALQMFAEEHRRVSG